MKITLIGYRGSSESWKGPSQGGLNAITLPATFDYAVRTTTEAAYSYVIPAQGAKVAQLNAYVGAAFLTPKQNRGGSPACAGNPGRQSHRPPRAMRRWLG